jgi:hypothetical protein
VTLTTLAIHTEAWLQEEIGAQRAVLEVLGRTEAAARGGKSAALERSVRELEAVLAPAAGRDARRRVLANRLGAVLGVNGSEVTLSRLAARLEAERLETSRLAALRGELREVVADVLRSSRRLTAMARYHGGLAEDLGRLLAGSPTADGNRIDARG